jgi:hypothetical protein
MGKPYTVVFLINGFTNACILVHRLILYFILPLEAEVIYSQKYHKNFDPNLGGYGTMAI